jgi:hypothetical protein
MHRQASAKTEADLYEWVGTGAPTPLCDAQGVLSTTLVDDISHPIEVDHLFLFRHGVRVPIDKFAFILSQQALFSKVHKVLAQAALKLYFRTGKSSLDNNKGYISAWLAFRPFLGSKCQICIEICKPLHLERHGRGV